MSGSVSTNDEIQRKKIELCRKYGIDRVPSNSEILASADECQYDIIEPILQIKPVRTISGVAVVAVMTSPHDCPHGKCFYCPGGVEKGTAQSYTGREPAALRAAHNDFDPNRQVSSRLEQLKAIGHKTDKVDLIIMGGTFTARDEAYQEEFVKGCFDAMNKSSSSTLEEAHSMNEGAPARCIGMTVETRPDFFFEQQIDNSLILGATRVELGVQTLNDEALKAMKRGHGASESARASQLARDAGMKVGYHMMPGLPGETPASDLETFGRLFEDEKFKPDMLKIYPTLVIEGTGLHQMWKSGDYEPYSIDQLVQLLADVKSNLPPWVRIQRIQRDIPVQLIDAGAKKSHLRELVQKELASRGQKCSCIRCREAGHAKLKTGQEPENVQLKTTEYPASGGREIFMSYEDVENDILVAFVRLRIPSKLAHRPEMKKSGIIRELRVLGEAVPFGERKEDAWQHKGYGELLIDECKSVIQNAGLENLLVMSGVGVRGYYRKLGFERVGPYMGKKIT